MNVATQKSRAAREPVALNLSRGGILDGCRGNHVHYRVHTERGVSIHISHM